MGKSDIKNATYSVLVIATLLLVAVTVAAMYAGRYHPAESTLMPLLGLCVPFLLIANLLVSFAWIVARKGWFLLTLGAVACHFNYLNSVIRFNTPPVPPEEAQTLTVVTYNVHSFGHEFTGYSCKEMARYFASRKADILCFQEFDDNRYFPMDSIRHALSEWPHAYLPNEGDHLRVAVFSRWPLTRQELIRFEGSANCATYCEVLLPNDTLSLFNCHLQTTSVSQRRTDWTRELEYGDTRQQAETAKDAALTLHANLVKRAQQCDSICQRIKQLHHPILVCGDFNSLPSSYTYHTFSNLLTDGFREAGRGYMYTYRQAKRMLRIDYIFHSTRLRGLRYDSPKEQRCSDHNPVVMQLAFSDAFLPD